MSLVEKKEEKKRPSDPEKLYKDVIKKADDLAIEQLHREEDIPNAWSLSYADLALAGLNAYSPTLGFALPIFRQVVTGQDVLLFLHIATALRQTRDTKSFQKLISETRADIDRHFFDEYIAALQKVGQIFLQKREKYEDGLSWLVAAMYFSGYTPPEFQSILKTAMIRPKKVEDGKLRIVSNLGKDFSVDIEDADAIYVPGAGHNTILTIPFLNKKGGPKYILNDQDSFTTKVLQNFCELHGTENIRVVKGNCADTQLPNDSVRAMILSLIQKAGVNNTRELLRKSRSFLKKNGRIYAVYPDEQHDQEDVDTEKFVKIAQDETYKIELKESIAYEIQGTPFKNFDVNEFLKLTYDEYMEKVEKASGPKISRASIIVLSKL